MTPVQYRPRFIKGILTLSLVVMLGGAFSAARAAALPEELKEIHVLNRLAFGPSAGDIERIRSIGAEKYIQEQL